MTLRPDTQKANALRVIANAGDPLTATQVANMMESDPADPTMTLKRLYDDEYVARDGDGGPGDAYKYTVTTKGDAAARDLSVRASDDPSDDQPSEPPSGLDVLFPDDDKTHAAPDVADRLEDLKRTVDAFGERIDALEDVAGSNNVAREDIKHRLRQIEARVDEYEDADRLVALSGEDVVRLVDMVAQSDARSGRKRRDMVAKILGYPTEDRPSSLTKATSDDAETTDTD